MTQCIDDLLSMATRPVDKCTRTYAIIAHPLIHSTIQRLRFTLYCALSLHIKEHQVIEISQDLHYGFSLLSIFYGSGWILTMTKEEILAKA